MKWFIFPWRPVVVLMSSLLILCRFCPPELNPSCLYFIMCPLKDELWWKARLWMAAYGPATSHNVSNASAKPSWFGVKMPHAARMATTSIIPGLWIVSRSLGFPLLASPWISHWLFGLRCLQWLHAGMCVLIEPNCSDFFFYSLSPPWSLQLDSSATLRTETQCLKFYGW